LYVFVAVLDPYVPRSLEGYDWYFIENAKDLFKHVSEKVSNVKLYFIDNASIESITFPNSLKAIKGTMGDQLHLDLVLQAFNSNSSVQRDSVIDDSP
jgi:hypothetical protein